MRPWSGSPRRWIGDRHVSAQRSGFCLFGRAALAYANRLREAFDRQMPANWSTTIKSKRWWRAGDGGDAALDRGRRAKICNRRMDYLETENPKASVGGGRPDHVGRRETCAISSHGPFRPGRGKPRTGRHGKPFCSGLPIERRIRSSSRRAACCPQMAGQVLAVRRGQ